MTTSLATQNQPFTQGALDACISCGYCLPACPTYELTGDEASSPRGRINLMKAIQRGDIEATHPTVVEQSSFCLGCRACEPVCPAGVPYGLLIEELRDVAWKRKPLSLRGLMTAVRWETPLKIGGTLRRTAKNPTTDTDESFMLGCFERLLYPHLSRMVTNLYPSISIDQDQGCCGALHAHNGDLTYGNELAHRLGEAHKETIVTTSGGCAAHVAGVIGRDRIMEMSEYIVEHPIEMQQLTRNGRTARIAIQDSCHLRNGLGVAGSIRTVISQLGELVEIPSAGSCCGAAGSYSILRPKDARAVFDKKHQEINDADIDILAVVNPGCYRQVQSETRHRSRVEVKHLLELVHEAALSTRQEK